MSAFMCSDAHFKAIVIGMSRIEIPFEGRTRGARTLEEMNDSVRLLKAANIRSLEARYPDNPGESDPSIKITARDVQRETPRSPAQILKLIHSLDYQSCEFDGWRTSEACGVLSRWISTIAQYLAGRAYDDAEWSIH